MPATTQNLKLPYPLPTDPIADGANQIKALAEAIDTGMLKLAVVMIETLSDNDNELFHTATGTAPLPQGFTKLIGGFVSYTDLDTDSGRIKSYAIINYLQIEKDGTQITVAGSSTARNQRCTVRALVWGY